MNGWLRLVSLSDGQSTVVGWSDGNKSHSAMVFADGESNLLPMANNHSCLTFVRNEVCTSPEGTEYACACSMSGTGLTEEPTKGETGHLPGEYRAGTTTKGIMKKIILARRSLT
jgi:hypothetical protein